MTYFELRPSPGATASLGREKLAPKRVRHKNFSCPCGCGRKRSFTQPRSLRASAFVASAVSLVITDAVSGRSA